MIINMHKPHPILFAKLCYDSLWCKTVEVVFNNTFSGVIMMITEQQPHLPVLLIYFFYGTF